MSLIALEKLKARDVNHILDGDAVRTWHGQRAYAITRAMRDQQGAFQLFDINADRMTSHRTLREVKAHITGKTYP
jgi:hypothetical protein